MADPITDERLAELRAAIQKAYDEIEALAAGDHKWTMHIPAQEDSDSDLVISAGLYAGEQLLAEVERLRGQLATAKAWAQAVADDYKQAYEAAARVLFGNDSLWDHAGPGQREHSMRQGAAVIDAVWPIIHNAAYAAGRASVLDEEPAHASKPTKSWLIWLPGQELWQTPTHLSWLGQCAINRARKHFCDGQHGEGEPCRCGCGEATP